MESRPATAATPAAAAPGVEVVSDLDREWNRERLEQSQREAKHTRP